MVTKLLKFFYKIIQLKYNYEEKIMKVIFLQDVPNVARTGEIKEVADGYARNFLIPRKLAAPAGSESINTMRAQLERSAISQAHTEAELLEFSNQLEGRELTLEARTGAKDRLYGSVTAFTPYPHLSVGLRLKLADLKSGVIHWAFEYIWDTADEDVQDRLEEFYTKRNILGLTASKDRLGSVSSIKLLKFVAHETSQTLSPIR